MSKKIKFRGLNPNSQAWQYGNLLGDSTIVPFGQGFEVDEGLIFDTLIASDVILETVGQFTGILDKNKHEIYEGDIVGIQRTKEEDDTDEFQIAFVSYSDKWTAFLMNPVKNWTYTDWKDVKVIGNIHENPDLLFK